MRKFIGTKGAVEELRAVFKEISKPRDFEVGDIVVAKEKVFGSVIESRLYIVAKIYQDEAVLYYRDKDRDVAWFSCYTASIRKATQEELDTLPFV